MMWPGTIAAPVATSVTAVVYGDSGNGSDLEISFAAPNGQKTKIASYRVLVVKSADAASFDLAAANAVTAGNYTIVDKIIDAVSYTVQLAADAKDADGDTVTDSVPYKIFVLSVADGINATENALSVASDEVNLSGGGTATITISGIAVATNLGKFRFNTDTATTIADLNGKIKANGADAVKIGPRGGDLTGMQWNAEFATIPEYNINYKISSEIPFTISGNDTVNWISVP